MRSIRRGNAARLSFIVRQLKFRKNRIKEMDENLKATIADRFRNTELGFLRIRKNLKIVHFTDRETEIYLREIILSTPLKCVETIGKNHYFKCLEHNVILTVNSHTFTIITAKQLKIFQNSTAT